jgi:hypothetical protein
MKLDSASRTGADVSGCVLVSLLIDGIARDMPA